MDERIVKFRVGVMVLATFIITGLLVLLFGGMPKFTVSRYTLYLSFPEAPGVSKDTPVRKSGVLIGRVRDVQLLDDGGTLVVVDVDADRKLFANEVCQIESSLLGDATLVWLPLGDKADRTRQLLPNTADDPIEGRVSANLLRMASDMEGRLAILIDTATQASNDISVLSRRLDNMLSQNDDDLQRILTKTESTLDSLKRASDNVGDVLGDPELKENLKRALADAPATMEELRNSVAGVKKTIDLANRNLENLEGITEPLGQKGEEIVLKVDRSLTRVDKLLVRFTDFTEALNNGDGSLGRLINDPELYNNLSSASANIERLTRELRPIMNDVRIFTDKIARHPEQVGVGGALRRSSGAKQ